MVKGTVVIWDIHTVTGQAGPEIRDGCTMKKGHSLLKITNNDNILLKIKQVVVSISQGKL